MKRVLSPSYPPPHQGLPVYCDAEQLLSSEQVPDLARMPVTDTQLQCLCDTKDIGDGSLYYRFNADRAVAWCVGDG